MEYSKHKQAGIEDVQGIYESAHSEIIKRVIESKEILSGAVSSFAYQKYVDGLKKDEENQLTILNKAISEQHPIIPGPIVLRPGIQDFDILSIKDAYLSINDPNVLLTIGTGKFTSLTAEEAKGAYKPVADIAEQMGLPL